MKIYSTFETEAMLRFQAAKDRLLGPLARYLKSVNVSADLVSLVSGVVAVVSLCVAVFLDSVAVFLFGMWLHLFLDGLDGSIARIDGLHEDEGGGLLSDLYADSIGVVSLGLFVALFNVADLVFAMVFLLCYLAVNGISYVLATRGDAYDFVVRPRVLVLIALSLDYVFVSSLGAIVVPISAVLLAVFVVIGLRKIFV